MVVHTCPSSQYSEGRGKQMDICGFKASLFYIASARAAKQTSETIS